MSQLAFSQVQGQFQKQQLKMSPQMLQTMSLFALNTIDLREYILDVVEKNPALEVVSDPLEKSVHNAKIKETDTTIFQQSPKKSPNDFQSFLENQPYQNNSLQAHLLQQLSLIRLSKEEEELCAKIIQNLDEHGFNREPPENLYFSAEIKNIPRLNEQQTKLLKKSLETVKLLDPNGCACNNIQEYLLFQAQISENATPLVFFILQSHFELLENPRISTMQKKLQEIQKNEKQHFNQDDVSQALFFIKALKPYPAHNYAYQQTRYIIPEIFVTYNKHEDDSDFPNEAFKINIVNNQLPIVEISPIFVELEQMPKNQAGVKSFIKKQISGAQWLLNTLTLRNQALLKITKSLLVFQKDFFLYGQKYLKPLRLKDVAESINVHETTVSRLTNGKYLQCNWGIFELKYFFSTAISQKNKKVVKKGNATISKESVKERVKEIVEENKLEGKKLSDEKITQLLADRGISIARRTVAKYRSELDISSSFDR